MRLGIIDYDLIKKPKIKRLNPEIMKIVSYCENNNCTTSVLIPTDDFLQYDKLIIYSDYTVYDFEKEKYNIHPNKEFLGLFFNNITYRPLDIPDLYIGCNPNCYKRLLNSLYKKDEIKNILDKNWIRVYPTNENPVDLKFMLMGNDFCVADNYLFNCDNWKKTVRLLSMFARKVHFLYPQNIYNKDDLINFYEMVQYNFKGLRGLILIEDAEELDNFLENNIEIINKIRTKIDFVIGYSKDNIYNEKFYLKDFTNTLKKAEVFHKHDIVIQDVQCFLHTQYPFTKAVFGNLREWIATRHNTMKTFTEYFLADMSNRNKGKITSSNYLKLVNANEELKKLTNIIY